MKALIVFICCLHIGLFCKSQTIEDFLDSYEGENSKPYLQPLADLLTANLHTGIKEWSFIDSSFHFRLTVIAMTSFPLNTQRTFLGKTDSDFEPEQTVRVPTIIGSTEPVAVNGTNGTVYIFPGGYNLKTLPMAVPQVSLSGLFNSEISLRYFAADLDQDLGKISLFGLGFRHSLNSYFNKLPFNLSLAYFYQQFNDKPYIDSKFHLASAYLGKSGTWWSSQIMLGYQNSLTKLRYTYDKNNTPQQISIDLNNKYSFVAEISAAIKLWIFTFHLAANYSGPFSVAGGLGLKL